MDRDPNLKATIIGCGGLGQGRIKQILSDFHNTEIRVVSEPSDEAYRATSRIFESKNRDIPPNIPDLDHLLDKYSNELDVAYIVTPHSLHFSQAKACLESGLDVLVEKPMVTTEYEASELIETRDRTERLLVVGFQGSLSPHIRKAVEIIRSKDLGPIRNISGVIWQDWALRTEGTWRKEPDISGGGFLFDTGAHMLNTISDLAGELFTDVWALFSNHGGPVEVVAVIMGRLESGALVTINACGDTVPSCASDIRVFCTKGALRTGAWGESLEILRKQTDTPDPTRWWLTGSNRDTGWEPVDVPATKGVWDQFLSVRDGSITNPSPPELGLRMAKLWDAIKKSAIKDGSPIRIQP